MHAPSILSFNPLSLMNSSRLLRTFVFVISLLGLGSFLFGERYETVFVTTDNTPNMSNNEGQTYLKSDACLSSTSISLEQGESAYVFNSGASTRPGGNVSYSTPRTNAFVSVQTTYDNLESNMTYGNWDHQTFIGNQSTDNVNNDERISGPVTLMVRIKPLSGRSNYNSTASNFAVSGSSSNYNYDFGASEGFVTFRIVGAEQAPSKKFATVIPENATTNVRVILEQSTDLINWTAASPGVFPPSTAKRFFRVRSEEE